MNNVDALVHCEVIDIESEDVFYSMNNHGRDDSGVVSFRARYRVNGDEPIPLSVYILGFENKEKEGFEACDVASDSRRRVTKSILLPRSRTNDPELGRDLREDIEPVSIFHESSEGIAGSAAIWVSSIYGANEQIRVD